MQHIDDTFAPGKVRASANAWPTASSVTTVKSHQGSLYPQVDLHGRRYVEYLKRYGAGKQICEGMDYFFDQRMRVIATNLNFTSTNKHNNIQEPLIKTDYYPIEIVVTPPQMTPQQAIENQRTYAVNVSIKLSHDPIYANTRPSEFIINLPPIPIPVGCAYCLTNILSDVDKKRLGVHRNLVNGIFIVKGGVRTAISFDKKAYDKPIVTQSDGVATCEMTATTSMGTTKLSLRYILGHAPTPGHNPKPVAYSRVVTVSLAIFGQADGNPAYINVYTLDSMLSEGIQGLRAATLDTRLQQLCTPEEWPEIDAMLQHTRSAYVTERATLSYAEILRAIDSNSVESITAARKNLINEMLSNITEVREIYSQRPLDLIEHKLDTLAHMVLVLLRTVAGKRAYSELNNLENKRIRTVCKVIEQAVGTAMRKCRQDVLAKMLSNQHGSNITDYVAGINNAFKDKGANTIIKAILPRRDKMSESKQVFETPPTTIYPAVLYHVMKVSHPIDKRNTSRAIRELQVSYTGFVGHFQTPERSKAGVVLAACSGTRYSHDIPVLDVWRKLQLHNIIIPYQPGAVQLMLNGRSVGFCQALPAFEKLLHLKRFGIIHPTVSIIPSVPGIVNGINGVYDNCIYLTCSASRPFRPLLTVDVNQSALVIDLLNRGVSPSIGPKWEQLEPQVRALKTQAGGDLWYCTVDELMIVGAVELIDAQEQYRRCVVAQSYDSYIYKQQQLEYFSAEIAMLELLSSYVQEDEFDIRDWQSRIPEWAATHTVFKMMVEQPQHPKVLEWYGAISTALASRADYENALAVLRTKLLIHRQEFQYNYCEVDPSAILTDMEGMVPYADAMMGPRLSYALKMMEADSKRDHDHLYRQFWNGVQYSHYTNPSMVQTQTEAIYNMHKTNSIGYNINTALTPWQGLNQEDASIVNRHSVLLGDIMTLSRIFVFEVQEVISGKQMVEIGWFEPTESDVSLARYHAIVKPGERNAAGDIVAPKSPYLGLPRIGTRVDVGDCIIRAYTKNTEKGFRNSSCYVGQSEAGIVSAVAISTTGGNRTVTVRVTQMRRVQGSDKINTIQGQKTTVSQVLPPWELPCDRYGRKPDIIFNPLQQPGRMTPGMIDHMIGSELCARTGIIGNGTAFRSFDLDGIKKTLKTYTGQDEFYTPMYAPDGIMIHKPIFCCLLNVRASRHRSVDKSQSRGYGYRRPDTHQPLGGKAVDGALRWGEDEGAAMLAQGASAILDDRLLTSSDGKEVIVCRHCKQYSNYNRVTNQVLCPLASGSQKLCPNAGLPSDFIKIVIPGALSYVNQFIATMGVASRIDEITETDI